MSIRREQYTLDTVSGWFCGWVGRWGGVGGYQGLWKKYVLMRNMTIKAGEAEVGMKRSGSQLW